MFICVFVDDLDIAPDFFEYFAALYPVLLADSSLWCVSAWNDNGKGDVTEDAPGSFIFDFFSRSSIVHFKNVQHTNYFCTNKIVLSICCKERVYNF